MAQQVCQGLRKLRRGSGPSVIGVYGMMVVSPCGDGDNGPGRVQGCSNAAFAQDLDAGPLAEGCGWCQYDAVCHKVAGNPPCSLVCSKSSVPTLCTERLDSRTRKRDTRNGYCEMQQLDVSAIVLNMYKSERRCCFCREDGLHGGVPAFVCRVRVLHGGVPWEAPMPFVF